MTSIEFWFDFNSPYAYFASFQIGPLAEKHGRAVRWRPFLLGALFKTTGMQPLTQIPLRGEYARHDWARLARWLDVPFSIPPVHPILPVAASRLFLWLERRRPELAVPFARAVFHAFFGEGVDVSREGAVVAIAEQLGVDPDEARTALRDLTLKDQFRQQTDEAAARGIFGAPFFIVDGEPFWGGDRLPMLDEWLTRGGW
jgi:2-hydroxychromene-2-carboxylate isomerase